MTVKVQFDKATERFNIVEYGKVLTWYKHSGAAFGKAAELNGVRSKDFCLIVNEGVK